MGRIKSALVPIIIVYTMLTLSTDVGRDFVLETISDTINSPALLTPGIAWLMSYPNSGTSYTGTLVIVSSNLTTASNYEVEGQKGRNPADGYNPAGSGRGNATLLYPTLGLNGPVLLRPQMAKPDRFILTKTHCSSRSTARHTEETWKEFKEGCLTPEREIRNPKGAIRHKKVAPYDERLVKRAVHIMRNPLDNVVARFHLARKPKLVKDMMNATTYPKTDEGFREWCSKWDQHFNARYDTSLKVEIQGVPCVTEFFLYTQWHNHAFAVTREMGIPTHVLHYEDYETRFNETADRLFEFLDLERVVKPPVFIKGKSYVKTHYTTEERAAIGGFIKSIAKKDTWAELKRYLILAAF